MVTKTAKRISIFACIAMVLAIGIFVASYFFVQSRGSVLLARAQAVADHAVRQQTYSKLEQMITASAGEREELKKYFLTEADTIDFLATVEDMAHSQGVTLKTDTLSVEPGKDFDVLTINFTVEGKATAVYALVQFLETLPYMSYINTLEMHRSGDRAAGETLYGTVELVVSLRKV